MGGISTPNGVPRRLSKPRTNTSSILLSSSDRKMDITSPSVLSSQQDYFGDHAAVVSSQGERRSRRKSRSRIRAYLYGSNSEAIQTPSDEEDSPITLAGAARDVKKRMSRTGSSIMQLQSAKTSTARLSDSSSSKLQLTGSQSSDAEESAILADQIKERAYQDRIVAQNHVTSPIDEDKHVDSVMAPVRRKSLYTPGLATRNPSDILKKPPQPVTHPVTVEPQFDHDYYYDPSKPKESPLSQLAALHFGQDGRSTPSNLNYPQLGGLQLGTLRVTNGTASAMPEQSTPDLICCSPTPQSKSYNEYYTASEGSVNGENPSTILPKAVSHLRYESRLESSLPLNDQGNVTPRGSLPLRIPDRAASMANEYMSELGGSPFSYSDISGIRVENPVVEDEAMIMPQEDGPTVEVWRRFIDDAEIRHGSKETQEDALRKLNGDVPSSLESERLQRPSIEYSMSSRYSGSIAVPNTDSGYASNASLNASQNTTQINAAEAGTSVEPQVKDTSMAQNSFLGPRPAGVTQEPMARSISGPREMPQAMSEQWRYSLQEAGPPPLPYSFSVMPQITLQDKTGPPVCSPSQSPARKLQKTRPKSQSVSPIVTGQGCRELVETPIPRVPSLIAAKHAERLRQFPLLDHTFPSSQHTHVNDPASPTELFAGAYSLSIRFPSPANALESATMGRYTEPTKLDEEERSRLGAVTKSRTTSAVLDRMQASRSRASSKHRRSTIAQVQVQDDEWPASGIVRSPSWSEFGRGRKTKEQKKLVKKEKEDEKRLAKEEKELEKRLEKDRKDFEKRNRKDENRNKGARFRSTSRIRAKSSDRSSQNDEMAIADFGTVTESLGGSPYDIATSMFPRAAHDASNWHPHQMSTAMPRPKSVIGMDEAAGVEASRARSRTRSQSFGRPRTEEILSSYDSNRGRGRPQTMFINASAMPAVAAVDLPAHDLGRGNNRQRRRSVTGAVAPGVGSFNDPGGFPGRMMKAQSIYVNAPPVPALPSAEQVEQREAQITKSRPQSIRIDAPTPAPPMTSSSAARSDNEEVEGADAEALRPETLANPRRTRASKIVPDLWTSGSLERKAPRSVERPVVVEGSADTSSSDEHTAAQKVDVWEAQRQAWRQRRKSAGEVLLRNQVTEAIGNRPAIFNHSPPQELEQGSPAPARALTVDPHDVVRSKRPGLSPLASFPNALASHPPNSQQHTFEVAPNHSAFAAQRPDPNHQPSYQPALRPGPTPLAPHRTAPPQPRPQPELSTPPKRPKSTITIPRKRVGSGTTTPTKSIDRLTGRYDGGLLYGYEPGCGLGGSAGTRGARTEASRKNGDVSRGFGLDLSDVPIFVAPTRAR